MRTAFCGTHAQAPAVATCRRCGLFLCDACVVLSDDESYCAPCARLVDAPASRRVKASVALPVAGALTAIFFSTRAPLAYLILAGPPLWLVGLALLLAERRAAGAQGQTKSGRRWARAAIVTLVVTLPALVPALLFMLWMALGQPSA